MAAARLTMAQWLGVCLFSILFLHGHALNLACIEVKKTYGEKGFSENEVPIRAISGEQEKNWCFSKLIVSSRNWENWKLVRSI